MQTDFAFICDAADISGPKLHALGIGVDTMFAEAVPFQIPHFYLVAQFRGSAAEVGMMTVTIRFLNDDGADFLPAQEVQMQVSLMPGQLRSHGKLLFKFFNIVFPSYGNYAIHVLLQGHELAHIPIAVVNPPGNPTG